jgi:CDP-diacylglycerol---glycerol-3-phosphate 3-phosphatidyltransferase
MKFFSPPNQMTLLRILLTPLFIAFLFSSNIFLRQWSLAVFIFMALTDWYDGWLARRWGYVSRWGAFFDPLADKVVTSAALLAYDFLGLVPGWMVWIIVFRDFLITLLRSYTEYKGKPVRTSKLAKAKTFFQFTVIYYILILYVARSTPFLAAQYGSIIEFLLNRSLVYGIMLLTTLLTVYTGTAYCLNNWNIILGFYEIQNKASESDTDRSSS